MRAAIAAVALALGLAATGAIASRRAARESPLTPPETTLAALALTGQGGESTASYLGSAADWPPPRDARYVQIQSGRVLRRPVAGFCSDGDTSGMNHLQK